MMMMAVCNQRLLAIFALLYILQCGAVNGQYLGKFLGKLSELHHGVSGEVYAVDGRTIHIKDFTYDGQGPAAYFYASTSKAANSAGFRLRDETGSNEVIRRYRKEGVTLTLPEGKTLNNIKIFYVWCEEFEVNFGDVKIPRGFDYPRPQKIAALKGVHGVSSDNIVIVDAQTLLIPNLSYDGEAPDAKFWVGRGPKPSPQGIRVPDENGKEVPLRRYDRKTIVLTLPGDLTVFDIGHFGVWCEAFTVDFGHVQIPQGLNIPPSLKMLGVSPQKRNFDLVSNAAGHQAAVLDRQRVLNRPANHLNGHLEATTFRPQFAFRRIDNNIQVQPQLQQHGLVHRDIYSQPVQQQLQYIPQQQQLFQNPQFYYQQQQQPQNIQQRAFYQVQAQPQQQQHQQVYQQFNNNLNNNNINNQQLIYNELLKRRLLEEQLLREQLNRQHNRFGGFNQQQLQPVQQQQQIHQQQNAYVPFG